ncbi:MAG: hypothetical protein FWC50_05405 [Planctomycetaceae bacterium]|nr:hypothetical protein [Planctomycetaceae bacterium]
MFLHINPVSGKNLSIKERPTGAEKFQTNSKFVLYSSRLKIPEAEHRSPATQGGCAKPKAAAHTGCGIKRIPVPF